MEATRHFNILNDIAQDLSGDVNFPTCMDAAMLVRNTLRDPEVDIERVTQAIGMEPLIASKLLRLANSVVYNPSGNTIHALSSAITRLGFDVVRTASLAVALDQMLKTKALTDHADLAREIWQKAVQVAAIARVLARRLGRLKPDEAMMAGLVHNIGAFYLLYRLPDYPEYANDVAAIRDLLATCHTDIGESLLHHLGLPTAIVDAVRDQNHPCTSDSPCSIRDVLYFATLLADDSPDTASINEERRADRERYHDLLDEAEEAINELNSLLA